MGFYLYPTSQVAIFFGSYEEKFVPAMYNNCASNQLIYQEPFAKTAQLLGLDQLVFMHQTHGVSGTRVTAASTPVFVHESDFMITTRLHTGIAVATGDCIPLVLYSTDFPVVGIVHAGWRGTVAGIMTHALEQMYALVEGKKETIRVVIGPCARVCCYQVGSDFISALAPAYHEFLVTREGVSFFDSVACNKRIMHDAGIADSAIQDVALCTMHDKGFCSHRLSGGRSERQYTVVSLK